MTEDSASGAVAAGADIVVREGIADDVPRIQALWTALYEHQAAHGMVLGLPADAFAKWDAGLRGMLGRFTCLIIAERGGEAVGFVAGRIRALPPYLGGINAGFISEVYVDDRARGTGAGKRMLAAAATWFGQRGVSRLELHVVPGNDDGLAFYRKLGWKEDHVQLVLDVTAPDPS